MSKIYATLTEIKQKLSTIPNITSLKIGIEKGIGAKDTPFIRVVPEINSKSNKTAGKSCATQSMDELVIQVVYGIDLKSRDLEAIYSDFYDLEEEIRNALLTKYTVGHVEFIHTVTDEDRLSTLKSAISRFRVVGVR